MSMLYLPEDLARFLDAVGNNVRRQIIQILLDDTAGMTFDACLNVVNKTLARELTRDRFFIHFHRLELGGIITPLLPVDAEICANDICILWRVTEYGRGLMELLVKIWQIPLTKIKVQE